MTQSLNNGFNTILTAMTLARLTPMQQPNSHISAEMLLCESEPDPNSNRFLLGTLGKGITLYHQQVRALNLVYSLRVKQRLRGDFPVAVIGGGAAGVTAAAGLASLGYRVDLFEKEALLLPLQHGCETRWIHPHIYNWPEIKSLQDYAGLPILNWRAGTAGSVSRQIVSGFDALLNDQDYSRIRLHLNAHIELPEKLRIAWRGIENGKAENGEGPFEAIIFAVGFGVERGVETNEATSYWHNDNIAQPSLVRRGTERSSFWITGTGDGGLIDLLRVRITSFQPHIILDKLELHEKHPIVRRLRIIANEWKAFDAPPIDTWLADKLLELEELPEMAGLNAQLRSELRDDTEATLNGEPERLTKALDLNHASLLNAFLVHRLHRIDGFRYVGGDFKSHQRIAKEAGTDVASRIIVRHGTSRREVLESAHFGEAVEWINKIRKAPTENPVDSATPLWPAGWWGSQAPIERSEREFVSPATVAIATSFTSTLSAILKDLHEVDSPDFRLTLHRMMNTREGSYFQQMARYAGTRTQGTVGRIFSTEHGLGGFAARLGIPVIVNRDDKFESIWKDLFLSMSNAGPIDPNVQCLLASPFFAPSSENSDEPRVSMVLFVDSNQPKFFSPKTSKIIYSACRGLVHFLEEMSKNGEGRFPYDPDYGHKIENRPDDQNIIEKYAAVVTDQVEFQDFRKDLTFQTITSLDIDTVE